MHNEYTSERKNTHVKALEINLPYMLGEGGIFFLDNICILVYMTSPF